LEADLGQVRGVFVTMMLQEVILPEAGLEGSVKERAPLGVAAVGDPIRDVTFSDFVAKLVEGFGNSIIGNAAAEHAADHIAFVLGERSNGTCAGPAFEDRSGGRGAGTLGRAGVRKFSRQRST
jgi:hypothetical protein